MKRRSIQDCSSWSKSTQCINAAARVTVLVSVLDFLYDAAESLEKWDGKEVFHH